MADCDVVEYLKDCKWRRLDDSQVPRRFEVERLCLLLEQVCIWDCVYFCASLVVLLDDRCDLANQFPRSHAHCGELLQVFRRLDGDQVLLLFL